MADCGGDKRKALGDYAEGRERNSFSDYLEGLKSVSLDWVAASRTMAKPVTR